MVRQGALQKSEPPMSQMGHEPPPSLNAGSHFAAGLAWKRSWFQCFCAWQWIPNHPATATFVRKVEAGYLAWLGGSFSWWTLRASDTGSSPKAPSAFSVR